VQMTMFHVYLCIRGIAYILIGTRGTPWSATLEKTCNLYTALAHQGLPSA
jgi:hypothetical protein